MTENTSLDHKELKTKQKMFNTFRKASILNQLGREKSENNLHYTLIRLLM